MNIIKKFKAVIVDDEEKARRNLVHALNDHDDIAVIAEADNAKAGCSIIINTDPNIVFLDIKMPQQDGFAMLDDLAKAGIKDFMIVFVTAYDEFALKALKYGAFDYLLKPVDPDELSATLNKLRVRASNEKGLRIDELKKIMETSRKIQFSTGKGYVYFSIDQIVLIEAEGSYSTIHTIDNQKYTVCKNLKANEEYIASDNFIRIHQSYLINRQYLFSFDKNKRLCRLVFPAGSKDIPVSHRYTKNISFS